ncbi:MAG: hypothetical protein J6S60_03880 [Oscillospiraceae bacterium]|nr:hypothetical protein [Oscillospiraceae bacterium]
MKPINGYETTQAYDGSVERVTPGGHVCKILSAREDQPIGSGPQLVLALEIAEGGPQDGIGRRIYNSRASGSASGEVRWPIVFRQFTTQRDGTCSPFFKGMIKCIEESNLGYKWDWDEKRLSGLLVGVIFREEEFEDRSGKVATTVRPAFIRSTQRIREGVPVPEIKRLQQSTAAAAPQAGFTEVQDDDLPF